MKTILLMFDSLCRHLLPPYGCEWVHAPNFQRLAERSITFDTCYAASMPCMPARRELHTGRYNFLHRCWGPLEPFDDSLPELLRQHGVYTHLVTDHHHYFEDGGATYHTRYSSWEGFRGQEYDPWKGQVLDPLIPEHIGPANSAWGRQYWVNRQHIEREEDYPQARTFAAGSDFIRANRHADRWFLQIEAFDPHEPFVAPQHYRDLYPHVYTGPHFDWPVYDRVAETAEQIEHLCYEYAALVSMCDHYLGNVLDLMDEFDLWQDTLLIVNTDHGFLLGEHGWWGKNNPPWYNELVHTPFFLWDPRLGRQGERCDRLIQMIDLAPTLLEYFEAPRPPDMQGMLLRDAVSAAIPPREACLFGNHGGYINCTDGRYVYMRAPVTPDAGPLHNYTLMPTQMRGFFALENLRTLTLVEPFSFTKGCQTLKLPTRGRRQHYEMGTLLFDVAHDPLQEHPLDDRTVEERMIRLMVSLMQDNDAPNEQYQRLGLEAYRTGA